MALRADSNGIDASLYRENGSWCTALVDASLGTTAAHEAADRLPGEVAKLLKSQQASSNDIEAVTGALEPAKGLRAPVARFIAVHDGTAVLNELIPGLKVESAAVDAGPFPNFTALARARGGAFSYLVAEVGRDGGEVHLYNTTSPERVGSRGIVGSPEETHHARKVPGEYDQPKNQSAADEMARRNAEEVAELITEMCKDTYIRLIVLSGDVKSREAIAGMLPVALKPYVEVLDAHTRTGGADTKQVDDRISQLVSDTHAEAIAELEQRVSAQAGNGRAQLAVGLAEVVTALQSAQAEVVLVGQYQDEHTLRALSAEPWVAHEEGDDHSDLVMGQWPAPEVLLRATALTDATIRYVPDSILPDGVGIAALLRWAKS
ncbi:baeRF2 domain-containing protein [Glutamicibacter sp. AOP38-B1-38]|uniref:baeRF2 domain-containing protein n=1 Tax=Glutamicibacter sp. AOP38-B1-38 TaxID=3457680 RepID=UPI004033772D